MTNEKKELFATLGLIAEESVATEAVSNEPEVELTALESIESELNELDEIEKCHDETEKASFESIVSDMELLNNVLAYRSAKAHGLEEAALESISTEFGIATEGIKELAEKGIKGTKALVKKIIKFFKDIIGMRKTEEKVVKSLIQKSASANLNSATVDTTDEDYRKYVSLYIKLIFLNSQIDPTSFKLELSSSVSVPAEIKPIVDKFIANAESKFSPDVEAMMNYAKEGNTDVLSDAVSKSLVDICKFAISFKVPEEVNSLTVPEGFKMGPALVELAKSYAKNNMSTKLYQDGIKFYEKEANSLDIPSNVSAGLVRVLTIQKKFKAATTRELVLLFGKYLNKAKTAKSA